METATSTVQISAVQQRLSIDMEVLAQYCKTLPIKNLLITMRNQRIALVGVRFLLKPTV